MVTRIGNNFDNTLRGTPGNDTLRGLGGDDLLQGLRGADFLDGGTGNDVLMGSQGNDIYLGGAGSDYFGFAYIDGSNGRDLIRDFSLPEDFIVLGGRLDFNDLDSSGDGVLTGADLGVSVRGNRTTIDFGDIAGDAAGRTVLSVNTSGGRFLQDIDFVDDFPPAGESAAFDAIA